MELSHYYSLRSLVCLTEVKMNEELFTPFCLGLKGLLNPTRIYSIPTIVFNNLQIQYCNNS